MRRSEVVSISFLCTASLNDSVCASRLRMRRHKHEHDETIGTQIHHRMLFTWAGMGHHTWPQLTPFRPNLDEPFALQNVVDFVGPLMLMRRLLLPRLETIHIAKHAFRFKQVDLLELLGREASMCGNICPSHVCSPMGKLLPGHR